MTRYAFHPVTIAPGATHTCTEHAMRECSRHTVQIDGAAAAVTVRARMVGATAFAVLNVALESGIHTDLTLHHLGSMQFENTGSTAVTVVLAGGA